MKRLSLLLMASCALIVACQDNAASSALDETGRVTPSAPTQLWGEPGDKLTHVDATSIRLGVRGGYNLNEMIVEDIVSDLQLINWETRAAVPCDVIVERDVAHRDSHASKTIYINMTPQTQLDNAWYALQVSKSAQWEAQGGHVSDDAYIYYRFTTKTQPSLRSIMACQKEQDVKVILDYSEEVLASADGRLEVLIAGSRACERSGGVADGRVEASADFICRGASVEDAVTLKGLNSLVSASDPSITLAGADEQTVGMGAPARDDGCRVVYFSELSQ